MVKRSLFLSLFITFSAVFGVYANPDIKDVLKGLGGSGSSESGDIANSIGSVLNGVLSTSKISVKDVVGEWKYSEPAVEFKSENLLKKAGGAAASSAIVAKIKPYYEKAGINNLKFSVKDDSSFTMNTGKINVSGTIEKGEADGQFIFAFKAAGSFNIGKITAYMSKNVSGQLTLTFDASKLIALVNGIAKISSNSTLQSASSLLNSYDGLTVGFLLVKN